MDILFIILMSLCAFGAIVLLTIVTFRMRTISDESKELSQRLDFWMSEKSKSGLLPSEGGQQENEDESFTKRILIPLGEQVGNWMAEKVPYSKLSAIRKMLIKAGYRNKKALQYFYGIKFAAALCGSVGFLFVCSVLGRDVQAGLNLAIISGIFGFMIPNIILEKQGDARQQNIDKVLPDALDLLVICTEAGMGIDQSLLRVAANLGNQGKNLAEEIILTNREMNLGQDRTTCWNNLGSRTNSEELKNLSRVIVQSEKVGSSIGTVLRSQSEFLRVKRRQKAEEKAAQMSIKMMIPLALFIFPTIMAVTMGPPMLKLMTTFGEGI